MDNQRIVAEVQAEVVELLPKDTHVLVSLNQSGGIDVLNMGRAELTIDHLKSIREKFHERMGKNLDIIHFKRARGTLSPIQLDPPSQE